MPKHDFSALYERYPSVTAHILETFTKRIDDTRNEDIFPNTQVCAKWKKL